MSQPNQPHKEDILVVDDKPENLKLLSVMLVNRGYEVRKAIDGKLALRATQAAPPDLILLDINMPEMNGYEVCAQLKSDPKTKDIPIVFISASDEAFDKVKAFGCGGVDYITKPFQIEEVVARIENQLAIRRLQLKLTAKNAKLEKEIRQKEIAQAELHKLNEKLKILATLDGLTQVGNRRRFDEYYEREWLRAQRDRSCLAMILCDVDHFKRYNDHFGHQEGDNCLKQVAQGISRVIKRPADLVARYGGEEFAIILPQTTGDKALQIAEAIRTEIFNLHLEHPQSETGDRVSLSLGVAAIMPSLEHNQKQLIATADKALYIAKQQGRNRSVLQSVEEELSLININPRETNL